MGKSNPLQGYMYLYFLINLFTSLFYTALTAVISLAHTWLECLVKFSLAMVKSVVNMWPTLIFPCMTRGGSCG